MKNFLKTYWPWLAGPLFWAVLTGSLLLAGCSRVHYVPLPSTSADSVRTVRLSADSVYLRDSITLTVRTVSDTVFRTETRYRTHWRERTIHDTVRAVSRDTVRVAVPVGRGPSWRERLFPAMAALAAALSAVIVWLWRR